jgi:hypothetical protein
MADAHPFDNALAEAEKIEEKLNEIELRFRMYFATIFLIIMMFTKRYTYIRKREG